MKDEQFARRAQEYQQMANTEGFKDLKKTLQGFVESAQNQWLVKDKVDESVKIYACAYKRVLDLVEVRSKLPKEKPEKDEHARARARKRKVIV